MKKNGFTTIELLVCFVIISAIAVSMFGLVLNYQENQQIESIKSEVLTYKNTMTKMIQDSIVKTKITSSVKVSGYDFYVYFRGVNNQTKENVNSYIIVEKDKIKYNFVNYPLPKIDNLEIDVNNAKYSVDKVGNTNFVTIDIPFKHPDLMEKDYSIHIVFPYTT